MNDSTKYVLDLIKGWVWSGYYEPDEVQERIGEILEEDADEALLRAAVAPEFERKAQAEKSWPKETDCDRLDKVFQALNASGIVALHNAGYTYSDGIADASEVIAQRGKNRVRGFCFYHGQDVERAVDGGGLWIAFGGLNDKDKAKKVEAGSAVKQALEAQGLAVVWDGDPETRLSIPNFDWKRRRQA